MYRKEIGTYYQPYYDSGDYPQEIKVHEVDGSPVGNVPLFYCLSHHSYRDDWGDAIDEEVDYQAHRADRAEEIAEEKSQALLDAEAEMFRRMDAHSKLMSHVETSLTKDDDGDFQLRVNGKVVL